MRNALLVLGINGLVVRATRRVAAALPGSLCVASPYGRGQLGPDKDAHFAQMVGLGANPNVGAVLVVGVDRPSADAVLAGIVERSGKPAVVVALDDTHEDALELTARGVREGGRLARLISGERRVAVGIAELLVGIECGHSDATSGLAANPLVGAAVDRLVDLGAGAVVGETIEWLGAEHVLARRAADPALGEEIVAAVARREAGVAALGVDLLYNNPGHENVRGGLSTIEEKSLGAIVKAGERPIRRLLALAEPPDKEGGQASGVYAMDGPGFSPESLTGFASAGAQLMLFTTGPGNSFCSLLAPTLKVSANPGTAARLRDQLDFDASAILEGRATQEEEADRLVQVILDVASGSATWGEVFGEGEECVARVGGSF